MEDQDQLGFEYITMNFKGFIAFHEFGKNMDFIIPTDLKNNQEIE